MKLRGNDDIVRKFRPSADGAEARCMECLEPFGINDLHVVKPLFLKHVCTDEYRHLQIASDDDLARKREVTRLLRGRYSR
jgi:hypothetical protein